MGKGYWLVLALETGIWVLELFRIYLDVFAVLVINYDVSSDLFHEIYELQLLFYLFLTLYEHHPEVLFKSFECGQVRTQDNVELTTLVGTPFL